MKLRKSSKVKVNIAGKVFDAVVEEAGKRGIKVRIPGFGPHLYVVSTEDIVKEAEDERSKVSA